MCQTASFLATGNNLCVLQLVFWLLVVSSFNCLKMHACMVYKHAYLNTLPLLHSAFMLSVVMMLLKGEVGGCALNSHGNYFVDHGKSWNYVFEILWKPC